MFSNILIIKGLHKASYNSESGNDVFVQHSAVQGEGYKSKAEGQEVEFEITQGLKGEQATNAVKL